MKSFFFTFLVTCSLLNGCTFKKQKNDICYYAAIPNTFICFDKKYSSVKDKPWPLDKQIGWLVNLEDLNIWKKYDNNDELIYAYDINNSIYRLSTENSSYLKNRFELYSSEDSFEYLSLGKNGTWGIYKLD